MELVKKYLWHLSGRHWEKVMDKYYETSKTLANIHQRFLNKRDSKHRNSSKSHKKGV